MYNLLLAGCGNIGALYDFENDQVLTHAKAFTFHPEFKLTVFDVDFKLAQKVAKKYNAECIESFNDLRPGYFDCFNICTPTQTHFELLKMGFDQHVKLIVCEKPVSNNKNELNDLSDLYDKSESKVLVNYFRRFLPEFIQLKEKITTLLAAEEITSIAVRYQKGFMNNCSHALDLIQFLTGKEIQFQDTIATNLVFDIFETDPTLSLQAKWGNAFVSILGLANVKFSHFEIDLYFEYHKIIIKDAGNSIEIYKANPGARVYQPLIIQTGLSQYNCIKNYMKPVAEHAGEILNGRIQQDNFKEALGLNKKMLDVLNI